MGKCLKFLLCMCLVAAIVVGSMAIYENIIIRKYKNMPLKITEGFTYTAHTGCLGTADNSLEAIDIGVENGADIVEFDLNFNEQNQPVLAHDEPKGGEVTLDEAFERVSRYDGLRVNVDVKKCGDLARVEKLAEKYNILDRIFFTGIEKDNAETVKKACPDIKYYLNVDVKKPDEQTSEYISSLAEEVKSCGAIGINFNKDNATPVLVEAFHENGLLVSIWTVDDTKEIYRILSYGPDNVTTRRPDRLRACVEEIKK